MNIKRERYSWRNLLIPTCVLVARTDTAFVVLEIAIDPNCRQIKHTFDLMLSWRLHDLDVPCLGKKIIKIQLFEVTRMEVNSYKDAPGVHSPLLRFVHATLFHGTP